MPKEHPDWRQYVSRRRFLQATGMAGALSLAGCSSGDSGGTDTNGGTTSASGTDTTTTRTEETSASGTSTGTTNGTAGESTSGNQTGTSTENGGPVRDDTFTLPIQVDPTNYQYNIYNLTQPFLSPMQNDLMIQYNLKSRERMPYGAEIVNRGDSSITLQVRDDLKWHNGDAVTSKDLEAKFMLLAMIGGSFSDFFKSVDTKSDTEVTVQFNKPLSDDVVNYTVADPEGRRIDSPWRRYKKFIQDYRESSSDEDKQNVVSDLRSATFDEPHGNGPFQFDSVNSRRLRLKKFEDHPDASKINWEYYEHKRVSSDMNGALSGLSIDGIRNRNIPQDVIDNFPDAVMHTDQPALWGPTLVFNHDHEDFGKTKVRQALAYIINRKQLAQSFGWNAAGVVAPSGLVGNIDSNNDQTDRWRDWVSSSNAKKLNKYSGNNTEKAAKLLKSAGYSKKGGQWQRADGTSVTATLKLPTSATSVIPVHRTIASQLSEFGIKASVKTIKQGVYFPEHYTKGDFELAHTGWTLGNPLPYFVFNFMYYVDNKYWGLDRSSVKAPPMDDPSADPVDADIEGKMQSLLTADGDKATQLNSQLAYITNQYVPTLPLVEINDPVWWTTDDWDLPEKDYKGYQTKWGVYWLPRQGKITAKSK